MTVYAYDPRTRQYKTTRGRTLTTAELLAVRDRLADQVAAEARAITSDYLIGKASPNKAAAEFFGIRSTLTEWSDRFANLIQSAVRAAFTLGRGGRQMTGPHDAPRLLPVLNTQLTAARGFAIDLADAPQPTYDDSGNLIDPSTLSVDENGDVVDENGDPVVVNGADLTEGDLAAASAGWSVIDGLLARAGSYGSAAIAGYSAGQSAAWEGAELPMMPPAHPNCMCSASFRVDDDGQVLGSWDSQAGACVICTELDDEYTDYETGVYVAAGTSIDEEEE